MGDSAIILAVLALTGSIFCVKAKKWLGAVMVWAFTLAPVTGMPAQYMIYMALVAIFYQLVINDKN